LYFPSFVDCRDWVLGALSDQGRLDHLFQAEGHRVDRNRDAIVKRFLERKSQPEWLLMLDSDMHHPHNCGIRLTQWAKPVVGGLYFHRGRQHEPFAFRRGPVETDQYGRARQLWEPMRDEVYDFLVEHRVPKRDGPFTVDSVTSDPLVQVGAVATGCMVVHRTVLEMMEPPWFEYRHGWSSEDLDFCARLVDNYDVSIYCDFSVVSGHLREAAMGQAQFRDMFEQQGYVKSRQNLQSWVPEETPDLASLWMQRDPRSPGEVHSFYTDKYVGQAYLADLARWNSSSAYAAIAKHLIPIRGKRVLEIGSGIGTTAIQLAMQRCSVEAVEPNMLLSQVALERWNEFLVDPLWRMGNILFRNSMPADDAYDMVVAIDVLEHVHPDELHAMLETISEALPVRGRLFAHINWQQQDIYPMHYTKPDNWDAMLDEAGLFQLDDLWYVRIR
jgi:2-polyprenyl-3-methyl-5-hydroxy-6-metoxy-1,4-benzoquinol methylase